jgi:son of sevenless-like protein
MIALLAGLNQTAIRRLARTWELVNQRTMQLFEAVEWTMDPAKNRKNYFATLANVKPPCMPFFGVYLHISCHND